MSQDWFHNFNGSVEKIIEIITTNIKCAMANINWDCVPGNISSAFHKLFHSSMSNGNGMRELRL